ncbi:MAG: PhoH family protein [Oscillospiraceae bacterium]|nr:PhoH family protein [Oscillospiraceae bacterium]
MKGVLITRKEIDLISQEYAAAIFGSLDKNLSLLEREFLVDIAGRGSLAVVSGDEAAVEATGKVLKELLKFVSSGSALDEQTLRYCVNMVRSGDEPAVSELGTGALFITQGGKPVKPKTLGQKRFIEAIENNFVVFGVGPAGTGKTYLSVVMAVRALKNREISRIILTRPAVEAGEKLGFLPGDLQTKIDPYLRPLYDALFDTLGHEGYLRQVERGVIEIAPLAYMRGRTLDNAFVILDEAQNTTREQMKMFLTRLGAGSKMVINGDVTQIDLPEGKSSGLVEAMRVLGGVEGIAEVKFSEKDVVRFRLVADIVKAYERAEMKKNSKGARKHVK